MVDECQFAICILMNSIYIFINFDLDSVSPPNTRIGSSSLPAGSAIVLANSKKIFQPPCPHDPKGNKQNERHIYRTVNETGAFADIPSQPKIKQTVNCCTYQCAI
jgi:hypothetical protein